MTIDEQSRRVGSAISQISVSLGQVAQNEQGRVGRRPKSMLQKGSTNDPMICSLVLMIISYVVNAVSMITLFSMTTTYIMRFESYPETNLFL
jgi:hypothetical protein